MHFLHLTFLYFALNGFSSHPALNPSSSPAKVLKSDMAKPVTENNVKPGATNIIFQSKDGGQTWQDISPGLPENEEPEDFFAGESEVYLRVKNVMYRSRNNLKTPVWEAEIFLDPRSSTIAFNRSGVMAFNYEGQVYQKISAAGPNGYRDWLPMYANLKKYSMRTIFETSDGTILVGCDNGLYKSVDRGQSWKQIHNEGGVMDIAESEGVLIATGQNGVMRSTDNGEHWKWVISEGGVGIAVEDIRGGFAAISYNTTTQTRRIYISLDGGKTWKTIDEGLRPSKSISSIKQIGGYLICGHPDGVFRSSDMGETWSIVHYNVAKFTFAKSPNSADFGVNRKVFKIYVSGNVVYAVARGAGC